jgi:Secretion system C-terminal sorting domain
MKTSTNIQIMKRVSGRPSTNLQLRPKTTFTTSLITRLALALIFLIAGLARAAAQTATQSESAATPSLMMSFDGQVQSQTADLAWVMEDETNSKYFVIERSGDVGGYDSIGVVTGLNNNNQTTYNYSDDHMLNGNNYYRLRQVDMDGVVRYSKVVSLYDMQQAPAPKMSVYPNPASAMLNFAINSTSTQEIFVQIYSISGVLLQTSEQTLNAGNNLQSIAVNNLKSGNYFLKVSNREGSSQFVQPFVKVM